ncbi:MAG: hypothetical protein AAGK23_04635 [Pseudomonadota bacterium]
MNWIVISIPILVLGALIWIGIKAPRTISAIVLVPIAVLIASSALVSLLPGTLSNRLFFSVMGYGVLVIGLQFWCYWERRPWRVVTGLLSLSVASAAALIVAG